MHFKVYQNSQLLKLHCNEVALINALEHYFKKSKINSAYIASLRI